MLIYVVFQHDKILIAIKLFILMEHQSPHDEHDNVSLPTV